MDPATAVLSTLSLHDALPIFRRARRRDVERRRPLDDAGRAVRVYRSERRPLGCTGGHAHRWRVDPAIRVVDQDRKSTRLNSSHQIISYAVFCLKKKKTHSHKL